MKVNERNKKTHDGARDFDAHYARILGQRWPGLRLACLLTPRYFRLDGGFQEPYFLDQASVLAALALDVHPGEKVLDMCAAPGGKSLVIAQRLFGLLPQNPSLSDFGRLADSEFIKESEVVNPVADRHNPPTSAIEFHEPQAERERESVLWCNERSANRRTRLKTVLTTCLGPELSGRIRICGYDAASWGEYQSEHWDRILLDVPCSSERHLLNNPSYLEAWSQRRSVQLSQQAYTMGLSAGKALKPHGVLLYCTCALSNLENDATIERITERSRGQEKRFGYRLEPEPFEIIMADLTKIVEAAPSMCEKTAFGLQIWPDTPHGAGPLYFSRLKKTGETERYT